MPFKVNCTCVERFAKSLWSYCDDDWYCPQCGQVLCWLWSREQYPSQHEAPPDSNTEIWVYPDGDPPRFLVQLQLYQPHHDRTQSRISPEIRTADLTPAGDFTVQVHAMDTGTPRQVELVPARATTSPFRLQEGGRTYQLRLTGDFPPTTLRLRVCNVPFPSWSIEGRGIGRPLPTDSNAWLVLRGKMLEIDLSLTTHNAPLKLAEHTITTTLEIGGKVAIVQPVLIDGPPPGREIDSGSPARFRLGVDFGQFSQEDQRARLVLRPMMVGLRDCLPELTFKYAPSPVRFDPPEGLVVSLMYWGEVRSNDRSDHEDNPDDPRLSPVVGELHFANEGKTAIKLTRPVVVPPAPSWLRIDWAPAAKADTAHVVELEPDQTVPIYVRIDLSRAAAEAQRIKCEPGPRATLRVSNADASDYIETSIQIAQVLPRTACPHPLAIDFGNSYSYAAVLNGGLIRELSERVLPVHGYGADESFPTTLVIRRYDASNPLKSEFVIGRAAISLPFGGGDAVRLPVTDLKRWISLDGGDVPRPVSDDSSDPRHITPSILVQMFLYGLIRRAEAVLRRYYVTKIVVSYPAKLLPAARRRFETLVRDMCAQVSEYRNSIRQPLTHGTFHDSGEPYGVDEANAVATGFVLTPRPGVHELPSENAQNPNFVVAAFDLGGGSLDTALLHFHNKHPEGAFQTYQSEYLMIGGQADFGGDNVTVAVFEILRARLSSVDLDGELGAVLLKDVPSPDKYQSTAGHPRWLYEMLWAAAEQLKQWLSDSATVSDASLDLNLPNFCGEPAKKLRALLNCCLNDDKTRPTLEEVYEHPIACDHRGTGGYTVRCRIERAVRELADSCTSNTVDVNYVVLGGGGSRLPLVRKLVKDRFAGAEIVFDPSKLKCLVAEGLVRTVAYLDNEGPVLARSGQYTTSAVGVLRSGEPVVLIPTCTKVDGAKQFEFQTANNRSFSWKQVTINSRISLFADVDDAQLQQRLIGVFDLSPISEKLTKDSRAVLKFAGSEDAIELLVTDREGQDHSVPLTPLES